MEVLLELDVIMNTLQTSGVDQLTRESAYSLLKTGRTDKMATIKGVFDLI